MNNRNRSLRVLLDANLYVSFLLNFAGSGTIQQVVEAGMNGKFTILLPAELLEELNRSISTKEYLRSRIDPDQADKFIEVLRASAVSIDSAGLQIPNLLRDVGDNYLLAAAIEGEADVLVTGDRDLLEFRDESLTLRIVRAKEFLSEIRMAS